MIIYKVGDEKEAVCSVCEAMRTVSYQLRVCRLMMAAVW